MRKTEGTANFSAEEWQDYLHILTGSLQLLWWEMWLSWVRAGSRGSWKEVGDNSGLALGESSGDAEKQAGSGCVLKMTPTGFAEARSGDSDWSESF